MFQFVYLKCNVRLNCWFLYLVLYIVDGCLKKYNNMFTIWFNKLNEIMGVYVIKGVYVNEQML